MCINKKKTKKAACDNDNVNGDELDRLVLQEIFDYNTNGSIVNTQLSVLRKQINSIEDDISVWIKKLNSKKSENEKAIDNLVNALAN